jgi:hypothetical protein
MFMRCSQLLSMMPTAFIDKVFTAWGAIPAMASLLCAGARHVAEINFSNWRIGCNAV